MFAHFSKGKIFPLPLLWHYNSIIIFIFLFPLTKAKHKDFEASNNTLCILL